MAAEVAHAATQELFQKRMGGQLGQCFRSPGAEILGRGIGGGAEQAADLAGFVTDGAVGKRIKGFLEEIPPVHIKVHVVHKTWLRLF